MYITSRKKTWREIDASLKILVIGTAIADYLLTDGLLI